MVKQKIINTYEFKELNPTIQEKVISRFRENQDNSFQLDDCISNMVYEIQEKVGVQIPLKVIEWEILSRSNQISISSADIIKALSIKYPYLNDLDIPRKFGVYTNYLGGGLSRSEIKENAVIIDEDFDELKRVYAIKNILEDLDKILEIFENTFKNLYSTHEDINSDEFIIEGINENQYEFDEFGRTL